MCGSLEWVSASRFVGRRLVGSNHNVGTFFHFLKDIPGFLSFFLDIANIYIFYLFSLYVLFIRSDKFMHIRVWSVTSYIHNVTVQGTVSVLFSI